MANPGTPPNVDILSGTTAFITAYGDFLQQKFDAKGKKTTNAQQNSKAGAPWGNFLDDFMLAVVAALEGGGVATYFDNRSAPVVSPEAALGGGTADFTIVVGRDFGSAIWLKIVSDAASVSGQIDFYADAARTKLVYSAVFAGTEHIEGTPWAAIADDGSNLESKTLYGRVTNNGAANSTYSTQLVLQG